MSPANHDAAESAPTSSPASSLESNAALLLRTGHRVDVNESSSLVRISNPEGRVELTVRCTADGCVLEFATAELALSAPGKVALQCDELAVDARRGIALNTDGDWTSQVAGHSTTRVGGRAETHADEVEIRANRGDALVHANDRVRLVGEQILLNSENEGLTSKDQLEAFWRSFGL